MPLASEETRTCCISRPIEREGGSPEFKHTCTSFEEREVLGEMYKISEGQRLISQSIALPSLPLHIRYSITPCSSPHSSCLPPFHSRLPSMSTPITTRTYAWPSMLLLNRHQFLCESRSQSRYTVSRGPSNNTVYAKPHLPQHPQATVVP